MDNPSALPPADTPGWWLSLYPDAGEAGGTFRRRAPGRPPAIGGKRPDRERARTEAARRARARLRRYCAANRLNRLGTLTYAPPFCTDPVRVRSDVGAFFRSLRSAVGAEAFPYVWVPEWHADKERLHLHFAVGRFIRKSLIEQSWGHGFVHIKLLSDLPVGSGALEESRKAAGYLSKYVAKAFDNPGLKGLHRFDVAQGFQPRKVPVFGSTASEAVEESTAYMGGELPRITWQSWTDATDWQGPPAVWVAW